VVVVVVVVSGKISKQHVDHSHPNSDTIGGGGGKASL